MFHEEVKKTIAGVQGAKNITDDIIVYGKTPELHDQALRDTLQKLKLNGLTLNRAKCLFDQSQIKFFGYVSSAEGISPDPAKGLGTEGNWKTIQCRGSTVVLRNG